MDSDEPRKIISRMDMADPRRAKLLTDNVEPPCNAPEYMSEKLEPILTVPITLVTRPRRAKLRIDRDVPKCTKSNTDMAFGLNVMQRRNDSELPREAQSRTDSENTEPNRPRPKSETVDPRRQ
jgi:hypothetical protein